MDNSKKPASPFYEIISMVNGVPTRFDNHKGLTKRENFAAMAMQGLCAHQGAWPDPKDLASDSVLFADALLAALESTK